MSIFDLIFLLMMLGTVIVLVMVMVAVVLRRWTHLLRLLGCLLASWVAYLVLGTMIAVATPQHIQPIGEDRCFDEMCFAVTGYQRTPRIEVAGHITQAHGVFYIVEVRISSRARGRAQHETGRIGMLIDQSGHIYSPSAEGMRALVEAEGPTPGLDTDLNPGESVTARLVYDLPSDIKRPGFALGNSLLLYPPRIIIADDMHFLHKPTITPLE